MCVHLEIGESVVAESDSMVMNDGNVSLEGRLQGGLFSSIARNIFSEESLFQQVAKADKGKAGDVYLAPQLPGDIEIIDIGKAQYYLNSGCFMASDIGVKTTQRLNTSLLGAFFGGTGGIVVMATEGEGKLCVSGFGQIIRIDVNHGEEVVIDNGHVVAWDTRLKYKVTTASSKRGLVGRLISTAMSGEMAVTKFSGEGYIYISSRNQTSFEHYLRAITAPPR